MGNSHATMLTASWKRQLLNNVLHPENGHYLDGKIGTTLGTFLSSTALIRTSARAGYFFTPENKNSARSSYADKRVTPLPAIMPMSPRG